ncbi:MAG: hypothetical protein Q7R81_07965, partial [Candidatus Peregrinibacteria bacterium]|nr:hypothetical protein [Candidatus Peregrinibacteria bacterium]
MHAAAVPEAGPQRSFAHPQCALCAGAATGLVAGTDSAKAVDRFDLEEARPDGSHLIFLLHGRHETT